MDRSKRSEFLPECILTNTKTTTKMKTQPTINQINGRLLNAQDINEYQKNGSDYERYNTANYKNRYFNFVFGERSANITINGTFVYCAAEKQLCDIAGLKTNDYYTNQKSAIYKAICPSTGVTQEFNLTVKIEFSGVWLQVRTNFKGMQGNSTGYGNFYSCFQVRSNYAFQELDILSYFETKILPKYMYKEGLIRSLQIIYNVSKKEVIVKYKDLARTIKNNTFEVDIFAALRRRIRRKLNILVDEYSNLNNGHLTHILKNFSRQAKPTKVVKAPSIWELHEHCSQIADTDEGIMEEANNVLNEYEGCILI